jgi:hypothetical protein
MFSLEKPCNAPSDGAYQCALWDIGFTLPLWTDWYVCPPMSRSCRRH